MSGGWEKPANFWEVWARAGGRKRYNAERKRRKQARRLEIILRTDWRHPDVGTQGQFKKTKPPATLRYDSSLSPALDWDGQNAARERGEALLAELISQTARLKSAANDKERQAAIALIEAAAQGLKALGR